MLKIKILRLKSSTCPSYDFIDKKETLRRNFILNHSNKSENGQGVLKQQDRRLSKKSLQTGSLLGACNGA